MDLETKSLDLASGTVLVVDDVEDDLARIVEFVSQLGCRVLKATNMQDALELIEREQVDMLVTDIVMPMYRLRKEQYKEWVEVATTSHKYLRAGLSTMPMETTVTRTVEEATEDYGDFGGFRLLDEARKKIPWLPVVIVSRYADLEMARRALGRRVDDILSKQEHLNDEKALLDSVRRNWRPIFPRLAQFERSSFLDYLGGIEESAFVGNLLVPLLEVLGYREVRIVHGSNECGIDLLLWETDTLDNRRYIGVQAKARPIHRSVLRRDGGNIVGILHQLQLAFESEFLTSNGKVRLDRVIIATTQSISRPAQTYIRHGLRGRAFEQHVEFVDAIAVWELFQRAAANIRRAYTKSVS